MARRKALPSYRKRKRSKSRSDAEYIASAAKLSVLVPAMKPLAKRKKLKPKEKSLITRRERQLKGIPNIFPITAAQEKKMKGQTIFKGVRGIQLRGVSPDAKIKFRGKNLSVEENGRKWIYWHLSRAVVRSKRKMRAAGSAAFAHQFPIELVEQLAKEAFKTLEVVQVNLWAHAGIVGDAHHTLNEFVQWVNEKWNAGRYVRTSIYGGESDPGKWVNGIAILLENEEYRRKRAEALEKNKNVLSDLRKEGLAYRKKEAARMKRDAKTVAKLFPPTPPKKRKKRK